MMNAMNNLDDETKLKFIEVFARRNNYSTILLVAIIFLYFAAIQWYPQYISGITAIYLSIYIIYAAIKSILDYGKLKQIGTPAAYIKSYTFACIIYVTGILAIAGIQIAGFLGLWR